MEDEIKVGDYIRTEDGNIGTIKHKITVHENDKFIRNEYRTSFNVYYYTDNQMQECGWKIKNNIIDLIEINDYVNGYKVIKINEPSLANDYKRIIYCNECEGLYQGIFTNEDIKSIVTHEQFKSIEYTIHEREEKENIKDKE